MKQIEKCVSRNHTKGFLPCAVISVHVTTFKVSKPKHITNDEVRQVLLALMVEIDRDPSIIENL